MYSAGTIIAATMTNTTGTRAELSNVCPCPSAKQAPTATGPNATIAASTVFMPITLAERDGERGSQRRKGDGKLMAFGLRVESSTRAEVLQAARSTRRRR